MEENAIKNKTKFNEKVKHEVLVQSISNDRKANAECKTNEDETTIVKSELQEILVSLEKCTDVECNDLNASATSFVSQMSVTSDISSSSSSSSDEVDSWNELDPSLTLDELDSMDINFSDILNENTARSVDNQHDSVENIINELANELQSQTDQQPDNITDFQQYQHQESLTLNYEQYGQGTSSGMKTLCHFTPNSLSSYQAIPQTFTNIPELTSAVHNQVAENYIDLDLSQYIPVCSSEPVVHYQNDLTFLTDSIHLLNQ